jgi:hypothetical protein
MVHAKTLIQPEYVEAFRYEKDTTHRVTPRNLKDYRCSKAPRFIAGTPFSIVKKCDEAFH